MSVNRASKGGLRGLFKFFLSFFFSLFFFFPFLLVRTCLRRPPFSWSLFWCLVANCAFVECCVCGVSFSLSLPTAVPASRRRSLSATDGFLHTVHQISSPPAVIISHSIANNSQFKLSFLSFLFFFVKSIYEN